MPKYSFIIPVYNVEDYILDCAKSIKKQKYENYEAIFVDDGSKDKSIDILKKYFQKINDRRFKIVKKKNGGLSSARNFGLKKAKGKYICFIDSDDFIDKSYLLEIDKKIDDETDILIFDFYEYHDKNKLYKKSGLDIQNEDMIKNILISAPSAWNKVYRKELFLNNEIEYPEGLWYEDLGTTPRLILGVNNIKYLDKGLYYYRQRQGSIMSSFNKKNFDMYKILNLVYDYYQKNKKLKLYEEEIERMFIFQCYFMINCCSKFNFEGRQKEQENIIKYLKVRFPNWHKNRYYKKVSFKNKIFMNVMKNKNMIGIYNFVRGMLK